MTKDSSGTSSLVNVYHNSTGGFDVYQSSFLVSGAMGAGTYWLTLWSTTTSTGGLAGWDDNGGPSLAMWKDLSGINPIMSIPSESFSIAGNLAPCPARCCFSVLTSRVSQL